MKIDKALGTIKRMGTGPDQTIGGNFDPHVYFAYSAGRVKIGTSINVSSRKGNLSGHSPLPVAVLWTMPGGAEVESEFHDIFADDRLHGEWFTLSPDLRSFLEIKLCKVGIRKFRKAETDFRQWVREIQI